MINKEAMVGRALKQAVIATFLSFAVAGCTTVAPTVEPAPTAKYRTKVVRTTTEPKVKVVQQKKVTAKKLIKPVKNETAPVIAPLGGSGGGGGGGW
ncbi:hypothetical protein LB535_15565 [Mesorhizobium sp. CA10]|uniref:hypothetical protein n=1 Tax=Mesorhizobium sp. CA10 TaxID=588495 RepID=UPI001CC8F2A9|nr:hypothetical protein [Mesorhizobium sp. CA10]MBZ9883771.1 hypothetical protein [Mesorhizobium sp. CA10]